MVTSATKPAKDAGSDRLLSFATSQGLNEAETLACFGRFYREDVPKNPEGSDHRNIRNFMRSGWGGAVRRTGAQDLRLSRGKASIGRASCREGVCQYVSI